MSQIFILGNTNYSEKIDPETIHDAIFLITLSHLLYFTIHDSSPSKDQ